MHRSAQNIELKKFASAQWRKNTWADIPFLEVTGRKYVQNGGRSIAKKDYKF